MSLCGAGEQLVHTTRRAAAAAVAKISIVIFHNFAVHRMQLCVHVTYTHRKMKLIIIIYVHKIQLILRTPCVAADAYNKRRTNWRCRRHVCAFDGWASYDFVGAFVFFLINFIYWVRAYLCICLVCLCYNFLWWALSCEQLSFCVALYFWCLHFFPFKRSE